jgi:hypothetical protein
MYIALTPLAALGAHESRLRQHLPARSELDFNRQCSTANIGWRGRRRSSAPGPRGMADESKTRWYFLGFVY